MSTARQGNPEHHKQPQKHMLPYCFTVFERIWNLNRKRCTHRLSEVVQSAEMSTLGCIVDCTVVFGIQSEGTVKGLTTEAWPPLINTRSLACTKGNSFLPDVRIHTCTHAQCFIWHHFQVNCDWWRWNVIARVLVGG